MARYAISDIHGCYHTFKAMLSSIDLTKSDELFLLGDYINNGEYSKEVIDLIMELQTAGYNISCLTGNHEEVLIVKTLDDEKSDGEKETLKSFDIGSLSEIPKKYIEWFKSLKYYHVSGEYILVHAGLDFGNEPLLQEDQNMYWIRDWYKDIDYTRLGNKKIIHGHQSIPKNDIIKMRDDLEESQVLGIDNGCYKTDQSGLGRLCCFNLDTQELYFEANKE